MWFVLLKEICFTWKSRLAKNSNSWALIVVDYCVETVSCKFVNLWATVDFFEFEWTILKK